MSEQRSETTGADGIRESLREMNRLHENMLDRMGSAARVDAVVGQPITSGDRTIVPLVETLYMGGYGGGLGFGNAPSEGEAGSSGGGGGYGGGGTAKARPVAVVELTSAGVRVVPVFDWTSIGLAVAATLGALALAGGRMRRARRAVELMGS